MLVTCRLGISAWANLPLMPFSGHCPKGHCAKVHLSKKVKDAAARRFLRFIKSNQKPLREEQKVSKIRLLTSGRQPAIRLPKSIDGFPTL
jgi:hypothetical protein